MCLSTADDSYTAANDLSSRIAQTNQSQWCFSKSFDGACPVGPSLVHKSVLTNFAEARVRGELNGEVKQDCALR